MLCQQAGPLRPRGSPCLLPLGGTAKTALGLTKIHGCSVPVRLTSCLLAFATALQIGEAATAAAGRVARGTESCEEGSSHYFTQVSRASSTGGTHNCSLCAMRAAAWQRNNDAARCAVCHLHNTIEWYCIDLHTARNTLAIGEKPTCNYDRGFPGALQTGVCRRRRTSLPSRAWLPLHVSFPCNDARRCKQHCPAAAPPYPQLSSGPGRAPSSPHCRLHRAAHKKHY